MNTKVTDQSRDRDWRTEIPNIVLTLGLSPFELALYVHLKRTAGDEGECWKSNATLAKETGMSTGMVIKAREGLKKPQPTLEGKSLITDTEDASKPGRARHLITIQDVWTDNATSFLAKRKLRDDVQKSCGDFQTSPYDIQKSPHDAKKEPLEERTQEEKLQPKKQVAGAKRTRATIKNDPTLVNGAVIIYRDAFQKTPTLEQRRLIAERVDDFKIWFAVVEQFAAEGRPPNRVDWLLERYVKARGQPQTESKEEKQARLKQQYEERAKNGRDAARPAS